MNGYTFFGFLFITFFLLFIVFLLLPSLYKEFKAGNGGTVGKRDELDIPASPEEDNEMEVQVVGCLSLLGGLVTGLIAGAILAILSL